MTIREHIVNLWPMKLGTNLSDMTPFEDMEEEKKDKDNDDDVPNWFVFLMIVVLFLGLMKAMEISEGVLCKTIGGNNCTH